MTFLFSQHKHFQIHFSGQLVTSASFYCEIVFHYICMVLCLSLYLLKRSYFHCYLLQIRLLWIFVHRILWQHLFLYDKYPWILFLSLLWFIRTFIKIVKLFLERLYHFIYLPTRYEICSFSVSLTAFSTNSFLVDRVLRPYPMVRLMIEIFSCVWHPYIFFGWVSKYFVHIHWIIYLYLRF